MKFQLSILFCIPAIVLLMSCGEGGNDGAGSADASVGTLIQGDGNARAVPLLGDYMAERSASDFQTSSAQGVRYYLTQFSAVINPTASAADVNSALRESGAKIVFSQSASAAVGLQIANITDVTQAIRKAEALMNSGAFLAVAPQVISAPANLPPNIQPTIALAPNGPIDSQVAARVDTSWSAATGAQADKVRLIVVDYFGQGKLTGNSTNGPTTGIAIAGTRPDGSQGSQHGYHVLGIAAAKFGGSNLVNGSSPLPHAVDVVDLEETVDGGDYYVCNKNKRCSQSDFMLLRLKEIIRLHSGSKFVINLSLGFCTEKCEVIQIAKIPLSILIGSFWKESLRGLNTSYFQYERDVIQVSAAGNEFKAHASSASGFNAAALDDTALGQVLGGAKLSNALVVENRIVQVMNLARPLAGCNHESSNIGGNIAGIGTDVYSFTSPSTAELATGTSMAAPQIAGTASFMFALRPDLSASAIVSKLIETATKGCGIAPALDAYAAILSLDDQISSTVRTTLIKGTKDDKKINSTDVERFLRKYFPTYYGDSATTGELNFSEFDLNGDGRTGGANSIEVAALPGGAQESLTDFQMLCRIAKSDLFESTDRDTYKRNILGITAKSQAYASEALSSCHDVKIPVAGLNAMKVGEHQQLGWSLTFDGTALSSPFLRRPDALEQSNLTWSTSGTAVSVSANGAVQALSLGVATVTVRDLSGVRGEFSITVAPPNPTDPAIKILSVSCTIETGLSPGSLSITTYELWKFFGTAQGPIGSFMSAAPSPSSGYSIPVVLSSCQGWTGLHVSNIFSFCSRSPNDPPTTNWSAISATAPALTASGAPAPALPASGAPAPALPASGAPAPVSAARNYTASLLVPLEVRIARYNSVQPLACPGSAVFP